MFGEGALGGTTTDCIKRKGTAGIKWRSPHQLQIVLADSFKGELLHRPHRRGLQNGARAKCFWIP